MTAELAQSRHSGDPARFGFGTAHHEPPAPAATESAAVPAAIPAASAEPTVPLAHVPGHHVPDPAYQPIAEPLTTTAMLEVSRKIKRLTETREIRVRTTHRRRKVIARGGVLMGFGLAMVVYPVLGNVVTYNNAAENVPGIVLGETPTTGHALLGDGPSLIPTVMEIPTVDEQAAAIAASKPQYILSSRLPDCQPPAEYGTENGKLTPEELCQLWDGNYLRADAALAFDQLNEQFKVTFGRDICLQEGYRSYEDQIRIRALRGYLAASPGKSMHGLGLAFDLCRGDDGGDTKAWLDANAATYGYVNPDWAKYRKYEPWHWEFAPGVEETGLYSGEYWSYGAPDGGDIETDPSAAPVSPAADPTPAPTAGATAP